jgi:two-component system, NarL family, response regulator LiaR
MPEGDRIRVMIVDDHDMVRKGLVVLLEDYDDLEVVDQLNDGQAAVDMSKQECVDVILMDMIMPHLDGLEAIKQITEFCSDTRIIALTSFSDEAKVEEALKAGAIGYLMKNTSGDDLAEAIRRAYAGESTLSPEAAQVLISAIVRPPSIGHDLTDREREVLAEMVEGLRNREIAEVLFISSSTVKNHVSSILSKLGTTSRTQAVVIAVEQDLVDRSKDTDETPPG